MRNINKEIELGFRWLRCGWRLFERNPWLLAGMGLSCALLITAVMQIPLLGGPLLGLLAPMLLGSSYLALDAIAHQKMALPSSLRVAAIKRSPVELASVVRHDDKLMPILLLCVGTMGVVVAINLVVQLIAGSAWVVPWNTLELVPLLLVLATMLLAMIFYGLLAMSLVYSLALSVLQDEPLVPAMTRGFNAAAHYPFAVLFILSVLLLPFFLGNALSMASPVLKYLVWIVFGSIVLPLVAASLYCSYRHQLTRRPDSNGD